jgi:hypothetical protein
MDFGNPHLKIREPIPHVPGASKAVIDALERRQVIPTGRWHLFVNEGDWSVITKNNSCSRMDRNTKKIDATLRQLDGQRLIDVRQSDEGIGYILQFDLGGLVHLNFSEFPEGTQKQEKFVWTLFFSDSSYVSYTGVGDLIEKVK